jgi:anti-sigma regulatory factor (Ser/Thr protein kinase)
VTLHFKNDLAELDRLAEEVRVFSERHHLDRTARHDILLALDELLTNILMYGMAQQPAPSIALDLAMVDGEFTAEMRDNGSAFDPAERAAPDFGLTIDERTPGGLGLFLVREKMDRFDYRREDGWNIVNLRKKS